MSVFTSAPGLAQALTYVKREMTQVDARREGSGSV